MNCIHITETKNLLSIKKHGILPIRAYLSEHQEFLKSDLGTDKVVYSTLLKGSKNRIEKYFQDFIYFKLWGKPRNLFLKNQKWENEESVYRTDFKILMCNFAILKFQINDETEKYVYGLHQQDSTMYGLAEMDDRFAHDDKPLIILPRIIKASEIKLVGEAIPKVRNNKVENVQIIPKHNYYWN